MNTYELMIVFRPDFPIEDENTISTFITKLTGGATIKKITVFGKKNLAYPIKKLGVAGRYNEGVYILALLESGNIHVASIEKKVGIGKDVLRYLLTLQKEKKN
jgi:ribosomal protein S6